MLWYYSNINNHNNVYDAITIILPRMINAEQGRAAPDLWTQLISLGYKIHLDRQPFTLA